MTQAVAPEALPAAPESMGLGRVAAGVGWRRLLGFLGPGFLIAVGYMDPGNWATDLAGGSRYGYDLLFVVMVSNLMAMLLQSLALKLGLVTGQNLAEACRVSYSQPVSLTLWVLAEIAIAACDLAEVIGSAIALQLLFHLPLLLGVLVTGADVLLVLLLQQRGFRYLEALVVVLIATVTVLFGVEVFLSRPAWGAVAGHLFVPPRGLFGDAEMLYLAVTIVGATVMPHNLYLHSAIVQTRDYPRTVPGRREALRFANLDSAAALTLALLVNAAILIVAAAVFHRAGRLDVAELSDAYRLLSPMLGAAGASTIFAVALLASGQNSSLTGTLAGQVVMEGFLAIRMRPALRRLVTRGIAIMPTVGVILWFGDRGVGPLLLFSQAVLSLQLSFAVFPLVAFTSDRRRMGTFVNGPWLKATAYGMAYAIAGLNLWLLVELARRR